jgi:hypothetical protein
MFNAKSDKYITGSMGQCVIYFRRSMKASVSDIRKTLLIFLVRIKKEREREKERE